MRSVIWFARGTFGSHFDTGSSMLSLPRSWSWSRSVAT